MELWRMGVGRVTRSPASNRPDLMRPFSFSTSSKGNSMNIDVASVALNCASLS